MQPRQDLTIRVPAELLAEARGVKADGESLNDLVVAALEREVRRRRGTQAYDAILALREAVERAGGRQPDSGPLIRSLREGIEPRA